MGPGDLAQVLRHLPPLPRDPNVLVATETYDDAGVYRLTDELALVQTVDFFTPVVDDPYLFGQIAAANALSDVYAMGGRPLTALNIVGFPRERLGPEVLAEILRGGAEKVREAGAVLLGGHTVDDDEPKYGLAVTGLVHPDRVLTNAGARPGDQLVLTKPLGVGVITTALKRGAAPPEAVAAAVEAMCALNAAAAEEAQAVRAHACTDVTGFGLLGHAREMAAGSGVSLRLWADRVPLLPGSLELAEAGHICGGSRNNRRYLEPCVTFAPGVSEVMQALLGDAITSGGLLIAVPAQRAQELLDRLHDRGVSAAALVGEVVEGPEGQILVETGA